MSRKRTKLSMSAEELAQIKRAIRSAEDPRDKERLQVVLWATSGQHSLAALAGLAGRPGPPSRSGWMISAAAA